MGKFNKGDWQFVLGRRRRVLFKFQPNLRPWDGKILAGVGAGRGRSRQGRGRSRKCIHCSSSGPCLKGNAFRYNLLNNIQVQIKMEHRCNN